MTKEKFNSVFLVLLLVSRQTKSQLLMINKLVPIMHDYALYIGIDMTPVYAMCVYIPYIGIDMIPYIGIISIPKKYLQLFII